MDQLQKYQRIKVAMLRQEGGMLTLEKLSVRNQSLLQVLQRLAESGEGVKVIKESSAM